MAEELNWNDLYPNLVSIATLGDGSCYFHAIVAAFHRPYITMDEENKKKFIQEFRKDLSFFLPKVYDGLANGEMNELSKLSSEYSLNELQRGLSSMEPVGNVYHELVSNIINKDIYVLWDRTRELYRAGDNSDILYKNRESIVICYLDSGHYTLIGCLDREINKIQTTFPSDHPFILKIKSMI